MKVKPLFIVILLIFFSSVNAQEYTFGLKGGINFKILANFTIMAIPVDWALTLPQMTTKYFLQKKIWTPNLAPLQ
jgi:hypothetical protein